MITQDTLKVTTKSDEPLAIYLAPFDEEALGVVMPTDPNLRRFFPVTSAAIYENAATVLSAHDQYPASVAWGIYRQNVAPHNFLGTVSLSKCQQRTPWGPYMSSRYQEIGTFIMRENECRKGIGTLAKLALMAQAIESEGTSAFLATVSEHNLAAQGSLTKAGFSHFETFDYEGLPGGEACQTWIVGEPGVRPIIIAKAGGPPDIGNDLQKGWERFVAARQHIAVEAIT